MSPAGAEPDGRRAVPAPAADDAVVLAVNIGSSSLKFGLYGRHGPARWTGQFEGLQPGGRAQGWLQQPDGSRRQAPSLPAGGGLDAALGQLVAWVQTDGWPLRAVAHRIVHGGADHVAPEVLDAMALAELDALSPLAPLHQPFNLAGVAACARAWPALPQVGCFDTAFHAGMPEVERRLPLPRAWDAQGVRRYGFHGLSYQHVTGVLATVCPGPAGGRAVLLHLGNGASACATVAGASVATSMGFSALDGLMMGTRCGSLDPGVVLHLWRQGLDRNAVERLLYRESGLLGVSGVSADMRTLRASDDPAAQAAIALFTRRVVREVGALTAVLGGLDLLAFTGGIGEHDARLRADVLGALGFLGVRLDPAANEAARGDDAMAVHDGSSALPVWVVPTDEGRVAAQGAFGWLDRRH